MATFRTQGPAPQTASNRIPWYVFNVPSGVPRDPAVTVFVAIQTSSPKFWMHNRPGAILSAGPFASQGDANNWIDKKQGLSPGTNPTPASQISQEGGFHIPNPVSWFEKATGGILAGALEQGFIQILKDVWQVIVGPLEIVAGVIIALMVLAIYFRNDIAQVAKAAMA